MAKTMRRGRRVRVGGNPNDISTNRSHVAYNRSAHVLRSGGSRRRRRMGGQNNSSMSNSSMSNSLGNLWSGFTTGASDLWNKTKRATSSTMNTTPAPAPAMGGRRRRKIRGGCSPYSVMCSASVDAPTTLLSGGGRRRRKMRGGQYLASGTPATCSENGCPEGSYTLNPDVINSI